jgi:hypothetical protein
MEEKAVMDEEAVELVARAFHAASVEWMLRVGMDSVVWPFDGGDPVEAVGAWQKLDESVREFWRDLVRRVGECSRDGDQVVVRLPAWSRGGATMKGCS